MATRVQLRRGPAAQWTAANPVLAAGEPAVESDTGKLKVGDGATAWVDLPYILDEEDLADSPTLRAASVAAAAEDIGDRTTGLGAAAAAAFGSRSSFRSIGLLRGASVVTSRSGNLGSANGAAGLSNGTDTSLVTRIKHKAFTDLADVRLVYANITNGSPGPNDITIQGSVELPGGVLLPVLFGGKTSITLNPGAIVLSDALSVPPGYPAGTMVWTRTYVSVTAGGKWPLNVTTYPEREEGVATNGAASLTTSGTVGGSFSFGYVPLAVVGATLLPVPSVAVVGDSIAAGQGDGINADGTDLGFIQRALFAAGIGWITLAKPGERGNQFVSPANFSIRFPPVAGGTDAIVQYGINDVNNAATLASMQTTALSVWGSVAGRNVRCWQTTITPSSTSSNTVPATNDTARRGFNDWLRAGAPINGTTKAAVAIGTSGALLAGTSGHPLSGYFEVADLAETARNSGLWKAGLSDDGTHPNQTGHTALAAGIDTSEFTV